MAKLQPNVTLVRGILRVLHTAGQPLTMEIIMVDLFMEQAEQAKHGGVPVGPPPYPEREVKEALRWMRKHRLVHCTKRKSRMSPMEAWQWGYGWRLPREWVYAPLVSEWDPVIGDLLS